MKPTLSIYLSILLALITIFVCGCGVGYILGKKSEQEQTTSFVLADTSKEDAATWKDRTLQRLTRFLKLSDDQQSLTGQEVKTTSDAIQASRDHTVEDYYRHLLNLHLRLMPHLDKDQQKLLEKDRKSLQLAIDSRYQSSITE